MEERRHKLLVALVFFMALRHVLTVVVAIHQHNSVMMMMGALMLEGDTARCRTIWMIERSRMFISR